MRTPRQLATVLLIRVMWVAVVATLIATLIAVTPETSHEMILAPGAFDEPAGHNQI